MPEHRVVEIPFDISLRIISNFDMEPIRRLTRVSRNWQMAAEPTFLRRTCFSANRCPTLEGIEDFVNDDIEDKVEDWILRQYHILQAALTNRPVRAHYVEEISLECTDSTALILCAVLRETQSSIRQLVAGRLRIWEHQNFRLPAATTICAPVLQSLSIMQPIPKLRSLACF